jgi:hypothetical protein
MRNGWLRELEELGQFTHIALLIGHQANHLEALLIRQGLEQEEKTLSFNCVHRVGFQSAI